MTPPLPLPSAALPDLPSAGAPLLPALPDFGGVLDGWRAADPVAGLALLMIVALIAAEAAHRRLGLPRPAGVMLVGLLAGPAAAGVIQRADLDPWKPLFDLAIGVLLFELGSRIRPRWLLDNPWLAAKGAAEALGAGAAVAAVLVLLGAPPMAAALAGAVAMSTSPVISLVAVHDLRSRGQVTERVLLLAAVNSVLAVLALEVWRVVAATDTADLEWAVAMAGALRVLFGSFLLGAAAGLGLKTLARGVERGMALVVLQIAVIVLAAMLAVQFTLSPLLALLIAGMVARERMGHALVVEPRLGSAGAALGLTMFLCLGLLGTLSGGAQLWGWVAAIVVARLLGKGAAVLLLARPSGLGWRQAAGLTLALQPASGLAVLMSAALFGWPGSYPAPDALVLQALMVATTLMQLSGPVWARLGLQTVARETPTDTATAPAAPAVHPARA